MFDIKKSGFNCRVVVESGLTLKHLTRSKIKKPCDCLTCNLGIPCNIRNFVYKAICQKCDQEYLGASYRPARERIGEHAASIRNKNKRTTLGQHILEKHSQEVSGPMTRRATVRAAVAAAAARRRGPDQARENAKTLEQSFKFNLEKKCKNGLEAFITEGILIKQQKPVINNQSGNGFVT